MARRKCRSRRWRSSPRAQVVKLDKKVGEPVDILVNGRLIARGEVVVLDEEGSRFGVVLTQVGGLTPAGR